MRHFIPRFGKTPQINTINEIAFQHRKLKLRSAQNNERGLSLVELLVGSVVASGVLGIALSGALFNRQLFLQDLNRTEVNDRLRTALDLVGSDLKQVGESLNQKDSKFPVFAVASDDNGNSVIKIRRNLNLPILRVCNPSGINAGSSQNSIFVYGQGNSQNQAPGCEKPPGLNHNELPPDLATWINHRNNSGGKLRAFIYNGVDGEFFTYDRENQSNFSIHREAGSWKYDYPANGISRIYLLEEKKYQLDEDEILRMIIDDKESVSLVGGISSFEATVLVEDPASKNNNQKQAAIFKNTFNFSDDWTTIKSVEVTLESTNPSDADSAINSRKSPDGLRLTRQFFPRNVLSN